MLLLVFRAAERTPAASDPSNFLSENSEQLCCPEFSGKRPRLSWSLFFVVFRKLKKSMRLVLENSQSCFLLVVLTAERPQNPPLRLAVCFMSFFQYMTQAVSCKLFLCFCSSFSHQRGRPFFKENTYQRNLVLIKC